MTSSAALALDGNATSGSREARGDGGPMSGFAGMGEGGLRPLHRS